MFIIVIIVRHHGGAHNAVVVRRNVDEAGIAGIRKIRLSYAVDVKMIYIRPAVFI